MKDKILIIVIVLTYFTNGFSQSNNLPIEQIKQAINERMEADNAPSVVVGITNGEKILFLENFGNAKKDDLFLIGSNSKSFTALSILILEQKDLLNLEDPVIKHLPWFKYANPKISDKVKIRDLLNQTSGISNKSGEIKIQKTEDFLGIIKKVILQTTPTGEVGQYFEYSNMNYLLLGLIIEIVSGNKYSDFIKNEISQPLGLKKTFASYHETMDNHLIDSYQYLSYYPLIKKSIDFNDIDVPHGYISSTSEDMVKYLKALLNSQKNTPNSYFNKKITDKLFDPRDDINVSYGLGWGIVDWEGYTRYQHSGLTQSFGSTMHILPDLDIGVIVMTNLNWYPLTEELADDIERIIVDKPIMEHPKSFIYHLAFNLIWFSMIALVIFIFQFKKWKNLDYPIGLHKKILPNILLLISAGISIFLLTYFPTKTLVDFTPNSGYNLIAIAVLILFITLLAYFNSRKNTLLNN